MLEGIGSEVPQVLYLSDPVALACMAHDLRMTATRQCRSIVSDESCWAGLHACAPPVTGSGSGSG